MKFVGSTTIYAYLQAIGVYDAHLKDCDCYNGNLQNSLDNNAKELQKPSKINYNLKVRCKMENIKREELEKLVGTDKVNIFYKIVDEITLLYNMDQAWNNGGKKWTYEYKFRKSGKTLCAFYFKENMLGFMIIFGKEERTKVEEIRNELSSDILETYDNAQTFHDGKWVMFNITDYSMIEDFKKLLFIKKKPNRK